MRVSHNTNAISIFLIPMKCIVTASSSRTNAVSAQCGGGEASSQSVVHNLAAPASSVPAGPLGAIAYDKDSGAWGLSDFSSNQDSANRSALGFCGTCGPHCIIVASFSNICAAAAIGGKNIVAWAKDPNRDAAQKDAKAMNVQASRDQAGKRRPSLGNGDQPNRTRQPRTPQFCESSSDACSVRRHPKPRGARGNRSLPSQRQRLVFPGPSNERRHFHCSIIRPQDAQHLSPVVIHVEPV